MITDQNIKKIVETTDILCNLLISNGLASPAEVFHRIELYVTGFCLAKKYDNKFVEAYLLNMKYADDYNLYQKYVSNQKTQSNSGKAAGISEEDKLIRIITKAVIPNFDHYKSSLTTEEIFNQVKPKYPQAVKLFVSKTMKPMKNLSRKFNQIAPSENKRGDLHYIFNSPIGIKNIKNKNMEDIAIAIIENKKQIEQHKNKQTIQIEIGIFKQNIQYHMSQYSKIFNEYPKEGDQYKTDLIESMVFDEQFRASKDSQYIYFPADILEIAYNVIPYVKLEKLLRAK